MIERLTRPVPEMNENRIAAADASTYSGAAVDLASAA
jgi:hypothetical protein